MHQNTFLYMKKILLMILIAIAAVMPAAAEKLFVYPEAPDTLLALQPRCDYVVSRFWDRCNFDQAFKNKQALNESFGDWVTFIPHASADTVFASINKLIGRFEKKGPETLELAKIAYAWLFSDTADVRSGEAYLPFAKAVVNHKKIKKEEKVPFQGHIRLIESSTIGATVPADIPFVYADGTAGTMEKISGGSILLFFTEPDCIDCSVGRIRLSSDPDTKELIERGKLTIVYIFNGETDNPSWSRFVESAPSDWVTIAMPKVKEYFELPTNPTFYYLNSKHKILASGLTVNYLLNAFKVGNRAVKNKQEKAATEASEE